MKKLDPDDRIETWAEIRKFTGKHRVTLKRWEKKYGCPILYNPSGIPVLFKSMYLRWFMLGNKKK